MDKFIVIGKITERWGVKLFSFRFEPPETNCNILMALGSHWESAREYTSAFNAKRAAKRLAATWGIKISWI